MPKNAYIYELKVFVVIFVPLGATLNIIFEKKSVYQICRIFWLSENDQKDKKNHSWGPFSLGSLNCWRNFIIENVWVYGPKELESSWNWHFLTWWKYQIFNILNVLLNFDLKCCILSMNAYSYFWMSLLWYLSQWEPFWISFLKTKMCSSHLPKFLTHRKWNIY